MDIATVLGFIIGFGSIALGYMMDGGVLSALLMLSAIVIVLGGSIGGLLISYRFSQIVRLPGMLKDVFLNPKTTIGATADYLVQMATMARQGGLLSLEKEISDPSKKLDPFLVRGTMLVIDGTDPERISDVLQNDIYVFETERANNITMFDALGAFAPAFGMVGTIVGLIMTLQSGMDSPDQLTQAIGVAFLTTLYGVLLANLFFIPAATKLRSLLSVNKMEKEMITDAVCAIRNGVNPRILQEQLASYYVFDPKYKASAANAQTASQNARGRSKNKNAA